MWMDARRSRQVTPNGQPAWSCDPAAMSCRAECLAVDLQELPWHPGSEWSGAKAIIYANSRNVIRKAALYRT
jgi:hypothetical protein